jgi:hypothetical protein
MAGGESVAFRGRVRYWDPAAGGGLAVVDVPAELVERLGGRKQYRVTGTFSGAPFTGSGMLVAGGGYCVGVSHPGRPGAERPRADRGRSLTVSIGGCPVRRPDNDGQSVRRRRGGPRCATCS